MNVLIHGDRREYARYKINNDILLYIKGIGEVTCKFYDLSQTGIGVITNQELADVDNNETFTGVFLDPEYYRTENYFTLTLKKVRISDKLIGLKILNFSKGFDTYYQYLSAMNSRDGFVRI